jgi:hypothetical protein
MTAGVFTYQTKCRCVYVSDYDGRHVYVSDYVVRCLYISDYGRRCFYVLDYDGRCVYISDYDHRCVCFWTLIVGIWFPIEEGRSLPPLYPVWIWRPTAGYWDLFPRLYRTDKVIVAAILWIYIRKVPVRIPTWLLVILMWHVRLRSRRYLVTARQAAEE